MPALDRPLDAGDQHDPAVARVRGDARVGELPVVEGDGQRAKPTRRRALDQVARAVPDPIHRIVRGVQMKVYFQHIRYKKRGARTRFGRPVGA